MEEIQNTNKDESIKILLISQGCTAERVGLKKEKGIVRDNNLHVPAIQLYCQHLVSHSKNRPSKKDTLLNSIKNKLKDSPRNS